jgi:hypothetical protein
LWLPGFYDKAPPQNVRRYAGLTVRRAVLSNW